MDKHRTKTVRKLSRRSLVKGGLAAAGLAGGFAPRKTWAQSTRHKVNVINGGGNLSLLQIVLLKELKLFEKYNIDANLMNVSDSAKILAGLISGDGDICAGAGFSGLFPAIERGAKVKIIAGAGLAPLNIMYSSKPDIKSVKDLPGRTVGTGQMGALLHQLAVGVMIQKGVDYRKVNFVNVGSSNDVFKALVGGAIDAGVAPIEFRDTAAKFKLYPLVDGEFWRDLPLYANQAMYASDKGIVDRRAGIVGVLAAYADMFRWICRPENKPAFFRYYKQAISNASDDEANFLQAFLSQPGGLATELVLNEAQLRYIQDLNIELGAQKAILPFEQCADMSLAREAVALIRA